jgi:hypothetical protein
VCEAAKVRSVTVEPRRRRQVTLREERRLTLGDEEIFWANEG